MKIKRYENSAVDGIIVYYSLNDDTLLLYDIDYYVTIHGDSYVKTVEEMREFFGYIPKKGQGILLTCKKEYRVLVEYLIRREAGYFMMKYNNSSVEEIRYFLKNDRLTNLHNMRWLGVMFGMFDEDYDPWWGDEIWW